MRYNIIFYPYLFILLILPNYLLADDFRNLNTNNTLIVNQKENSFIQYGPLKLNLSNYMRRKNIIIMESYNLEDQLLYLAFDCNTMLMNVTGSNFQWKEWKGITSLFEQKMLNGVCSKNDY